MLHDPNRRPRPEIEERRRFWQEVYFRAIERADVPIAGNAARIADAALDELSQRGKLFAHYDPRPDSLRMELNRLREGIRAAARDPGSARQIQAALLELVKE